MTPSPIGAWIYAARPKTLPAAFVPVMLGSACAFAETGVFEPVPAAFALLFALLAQIACNFANDYWDFKKGADTAARLGPARATNAGWISPAAMRRGVFITLALAFLAGMMLVSRCGWILLPVGIVSLFAALAYTAGPFPLAYNGLGDVFVLVFFGFVAVLFSAYAQIESMPESAWVAALACGLSAVNILVVNNARDMETDAAAGKRTTVVLFGRRHARRQYAASLAIALLAPAILLFRGFGVAVLLPCLTAPVAIMLCRRFFAVREPRDYNPLLGKTAGYLLLYGVLFAAGVISGRPGF